MGPGAMGGQPIDQCRWRVVTDVSPSQFGSGILIANQSPGTEVDASSLRPASVEARWAPCIMAMGHFYMAQVRIAVSQMSVFHHYGLAILDSEYRRCWGY
jgi:hypothetical protein